MNQNHGIIRSVVAAGVLALLPAAFGHGVAPNLTETHHGEALALGAGSVRTYVLLSKNKDVSSGTKAVLEMGVEIPAEVINSLPAEDKALILDFPVQAKNTPYSYIMLDWNPHGHEPAGIYDKPHFDFHFYIQDLDEVMAINPGPCGGLDCDAYQRAMKPLPGQYLPQGYMNVGSVVPYMGNHLVNPASPEFQGTSFTRTFLYGVYDGQITFMEPMITKTSIVSGGDQCTAIPQPSQYAINGYYPTKYCTKFDSAAGVYRIYLHDFIYRK
jgi:Domain of unknown function (DUF5602)